VLHDESIEPMGIERCLPLASRLIECVSHDDFAHHRVGAEERAVASALVLQSNAQDVRQRSNAGDNQMRVPGIVWGGIAMEAALARKRLVSLRYIQLGKVRTAARIGCPF
jgi:hypothetical protein